MKKPDQPKVSVTATATRVYDFEPSADLAVTDWSGNPLAVSRIRITSHESGSVTVKCDRAYGLRKDGTVGKQERSARPWWSLSDAPKWVQRLAVDMPTPKVTLIPPSTTEPQEAPHDH